MKAEDPMLEQVLGLCESLTALAGAMFGALDEPDAGLDCAETDEPKRTEAA